MIPMENPLQLKHFGFITVIGRDAQKFLQGYTTCDLEKLGDDVISPGAICNIQGRMLCNFHIARIDQGFLLRLHQSLVDATLIFLKKYIVFSKATLADESGQYKCFGLTQVGADAPQTLHQMSHTKAGLLSKISDSGRFELWSNSPELIDSPELTNSPEAADTANWIKQDIEEGIAWVNETTSEAYLPQMYNLDKHHGIAFDKGCYLGQEIVARMQYRGELKKRLQRVNASRKLTNGEKILDANGKRMGEVVYAQDQICLAVLNLAATTSLALEDGARVSTD